MTSIREQGRPTHRARASKAPTDPSSVRSDNNYKGSLKLNKPRPPKAFSRSRSPKAPSRPPQAPPP